MSYNSRDELLCSAEFIGMVRIAYADWLGYWASAGTASIEDPELREQTDALIKMSLESREAYVKKLATLVIADDAIKSTTTVSDTDIKTAVDNVLAHAIHYIL